MAQLQSGHQETKLLPDTASSQLGPADGSQPQEYSCTDLGLCLVRAGFGASVYLLVLYREALTFSVLQLTVVKTQITEFSCFPWAFSVKIYEILVVLFSWSTDCWWHGWVKKNILVASWSKCSDSCEVRSCEVCSYEKGRMNYFPWTELLSPPGIFYLIQQSSDHSRVLIGKENNWQNPQVLLF